MTLALVHGFQISLGTQGGTYCLMNINGHEETVDVVDTTSHCAEDYRKYISGDLKALGTFTADLQFEVDDAAPLPEIGATPEIITITYPKGRDQNTPATLAGTGFLSARSWPGGAAGGTEILQGSVTIQWDGETPPAFTPGSAT